MFARSRLGAWGALVLVAYAAQVGFHTHRGEAWNLLWACNVATVMLGVGCVARARWPVAIALSWLALGSPLWLLAELHGDDIAIPSIVLHVGAPLVAIGAARTLGVPRRTWIVAFVAGLALVALSRLLTPPNLNVNLAYGVYAGWSGLFPDARVYYAAIFASMAATFWLIERIYRGRA